MRGHSYPRLRRCASENGLNVLSSPFCTSQSLFRVKAGFALPGEPVHRDKGPLDLCLFPSHPARIFLAHLTASAMQSRSAWRPGEILSALRIPASLERPGLAIHGTPAQREEGPLDLPLFPPRPRISVRRVKGSLDLSQVPDSPTRISVTVPATAPALLYLPASLQVARCDSTSSVPGVVRALATTAGKKWGLLSCNLAYAKRFR